MILLLQSTPATPHTAVPVTEGSAWFSYQSLHTLVFILYLFFTYSARCPPLGKIIFPKEEHCPLFLFYTFILGPLSARLTQGSNFVLIWEYMGRACFKSFFASLEADVCDDGKDLMFLILHCFSDFYSDKQPFRVEQFQRKSRDKHTHGVINMASSTDYSLVITGYGNICAK